MKLYHYVTKGNNVLEKGLLSFANNPKADINYYIKRSGQKTKKGIVRWMESCFKGRSRGIRFFTTPLQWTNKSLKIKELVDACDLLEIDIEALNKDGYIEKVFFKPSVFDKKYPLPKDFNQNDEYLVPLKSIKEIDLKYKQTWHKCDDSKGLRMAPLRFHLLVIKGGIIPPKYIKKVKEIQIRNVRLTDAKRLAEINLLCWQKNYRGLVADKFLDHMSLTPKRIERFKEQIKESDFYFCILKHNQIVGYLSAKKIKNKKPAPYEILYFYIHPDFQHQGIGSKLFAYFKEIIHFQPIYLYMLDGNKQGQKFYQKMGGKRFPQFDKDTEVLKLKMHDVCFFFGTSVPQISSFLTVKKMTPKNIPEILELCQTNPDYYQHMPPKVSKKTIQKDMRELPPHTQMTDKFYLGFYDKKKLVALLDLIYNYPDKKSCFIGLFMVHKQNQGKGLGTKIIQELLSFLFKSCEYVQLGVIGSHTLSHHFWLKNGFCFTGKEYKHPHHTVKIMEINKK